MCQDVTRLHQQLRLEGPGDRLNGYKDGDRLWNAMLEWLEQFEALVRRLASDGVDIVDIVKVQVGVSEKRGPQSRRQVIGCLLGPRRETPRLRRRRRLKHGSEPLNRAKADSGRTDTGTGPIGGKLL